MSTLSNNNIDGMSVGILSTYTNSAALLEGDLTYHDKGILWDGEIKVFGDAKIHSKETFIDRIPVQVKGHEVSRYQGKCTHLIPVIDLQKYKADGGILYFVTMIKSITNYRCYYRILLPSNIENYIKNSNGKASVRVQFKELRMDDPSHIESICNFFINERKKQIGKNILDIDSLKERNITSLTIDGFADSEMPNFIDDEKFAYAAIGGDMYPVSFTEEFSVSTKIQKEVSINNCVYFKSYIIERLSDGSSILNFGNCISMTRKANGKKATIKFNGDDATIQQILNEKDFILALLDNPEIKIEGNLVWSQSKKNDFDKFSGKVKCIIEETETLARALKYVGVTLDITMPSLTLKEKSILKKINNINDGICKGSDIGFKHIKINSEKVILLFYNENGIQKCLNIFDREMYSRLSFTTEIENVGHVPSSPYFALDVKDLVTALNFNPEPIINNILSIDFHPELISGVIAFLLSLLKIYDETKDRRILNITTAFYENQSIMNDGEVMVINKYQIIKRERRLTDAENAELISLKNQFSDNIELVCCVNLLIDNISEFDYYFKKLNQEQKEKFVDYPIMVFYSKNIDDLLN